MNDDTISRHAAIDEIKEPMMLEYVWSYSCKEEEEAISVLVETICQQTKSIIADRLERLQSADVVEVIRCKDCRWYKTNYSWNGQEHKICVIEPYEPIRKSDDFCSRAEPYKGEQ